MTHEDALRIIQLLESLDSGINCLVILAALILFIK